jgi:hypothetical protein
VQGLLVAILIGPVFLGGMFNLSYAGDSLQFFRTFKEKVPNADILKLPEYKASEEVYVERVASYSISDTDIIEVKIEPIKTYDPQSGAYKIVKNVTYEATFSLSEKSGANFLAFANKSQKSTFEIRLGDNRLAFVEFYGRFSSPSFTITLQQLSRDRINELLKPLKNKVKWEG